MTLEFAYFETGLYNEEVKMDEYGIDRLGMMLVWVFVDINMLR